jgi:hypothetical protein
VTPTPKTQPILDELPAVRERLLAESGGTLSGLRDFEANSSAGAWQRQDANDA